MIDADVLQSLTDEQKARLMELEKTFNTDGWKIFKAFAQQQSLEMQQRMVYAQDWDSFLEQRGAARTWANIAQFEDETINEFVALAQQNAEGSIEPVVIE